MPKPPPEEENEYGREKTAAARLASLPEFLRLTPEQIEAARATNARLLEESNSPYVKLAPQEQQRVRAIREEADWRRTLQSLDFAIAAGDKSADTAGRRHTVAQTMGENLAAQGRFYEAATVTPDEGQKLEYLALHEAVMCPDEDWCTEECDQAFANDPSRLTREDIIGEVFSIAHGKVMPVNRCPYCKRLNIRPASAKNLERRGVRARARALTEGQTPDRAAETLTRAKLTSGEVFK